MTAFPGFKHWNHRLSGKTYYQSPGGLFAIHRDGATSQWVLERNVYDDDGRLRYREHVCSTPMASTVTAIISTEEEAW